MRRAHHGDTEARRRARNSSRIWRTMFLMHKKTQISVVRFAVAASEFERASVSPGLRGDSFFSPITVPTTQNSAPVADTTNQQGWPARYCGKTPGEEFG